MITDMPVTAQEHPVSGKNEHDLHLSLSLNIAPPPGIPI